MFMVSSTSCCRRPAGSRFVTSSLLRANVQRRQTRKFLRIGQHVDCSDLLFAGVDRKNGEWLSIEIADDARLPVDVRPSMDQILWQQFLQAADSSARHFVHATD